MTNQQSRRRRRRGEARTFDAGAVKRRILPARDATPITSLLIYARNKVGKTRLCSTAAVLGKTLIIDCEDGTSSISKTKAEVYKLDTYDQIDEIYWYLRTQNHGFKFVCIDPITKLGARCMQWVLADKAAQDLTSDPYNPSQQDWGKTKELMISTITRFKDLAKTQDFFLIITAYERRRSNDDEDADYDYVIGPDAQPAVKGFMMGHMDIIGRLYIKTLESEEDEDSTAVKIERRMLFGAHEIYEAGDRSDNLPRIMRQPTMKKILELVRSQK